MRKFEEIPAGIIYIPAGKHRHIDAGLEAVFVS